uniref:Helicase C-terminal domain-containing protein n=1 Tax=Cyprinus carpio TaxID=7962 RepID=A0A8C1RB56_CYPCA
MAQRKRKLKKRKKSSTHRYHELQSDDEEFEVAAGIKDDHPAEDFLDSRPRPECVSVMELDTRELIRAQNKKKKKSEAFQSMGETMDDQFAALHENPDMNKSIIFFFHFNRILNSIHDIFQLSFFHLRLDDKPALLLHLLRNVVKPQEQTVVFVATKHHVEYLKELLMVEGVECAYIYSALDQTASKINIGRFVQRKAMVLLVTDVVARGIDIPLLDNSRCDGLALPEHTQGTANSADIQKLKLGIHSLTSDVYRMICIYMFPQTVFEINSNNRTNASEVMRAKRSRDSRLVDKFSKVQAELIAEHIVPTITRTEPQHHEDEQEDDNVISERKSLNLKLCALCSSSLSFPLDGMFFQEGLLIYLVV